jgi:hypothetical protein
MRFRIHKMTLDCVVVDRSGSPHLCPKIFFYDLLLVYAFLELQLFKILAKWQGENVNLERNEVRSIVQ